MYAYYLFIYLCLLLHVFPLNLIEGLYNFILSSQDSSVFDSYISALSTPGIRFFGIKMVVILVQAPLINLLSDCTIV